MSRWRTPGLVDGATLRGGHSKQDLGRLAICGSFPTLADPQEVTKGVRGALVIGKLGKTYRDLIAANLGWCELLRELHCPRSGPILGTVTRGSVRGPCRAANVGKRRLVRREVNLANVSKGRRRHGRRRLDRYRIGISLGSLESLTNKALWSGESSLIFTGQRTGTVLD